MKKKFAIFDATRKDQPDERPALTDLEGEAHKLQALVIKTITDYNFVFNEKHSIFDELIEYLSHKRPDVLLIYDLRRVAYSYQELVKLLLVLEEHGIGLISLRQNLNTADPGHDVIWSLAGALQDIGSYQHSRRTKRGLETAKKKGTKLGRPGIPREDLERSIVLIEETLNDPDTALQPWQIQKKCGISDASYYGIRLVMMDVKQGKPLDHIVETNHLGKRTIRRIFEILSTRESVKVPDL